MKKGLQGPEQVFPYKYCKSFKNTYFEKHLQNGCFENQHLSDKFTEVG